ncbi:MAG: TraB/GumN family protein [Saprospiraceae bacterium]|nr:TraB/GumN family protein [Saprospiraceae bacterium]
MKDFAGSLTIKLLLLLVIIFGSCKTSQQSQLQKSEVSTAKTETALLWRIEGEDIKSSYLFGTIHMIDKDEYFFTEEMESALLETEGLALEIDLENAMDLGSQMGLLQKAFMRNDTTLQDLLTQEEYTLVKAHFEDMGIPFFLFERVKPMFLTIFASEDMFSGGGLNMDDVKSYELELIEKAKAQDKAVTGLETVDYQMSIFDSIPYGAQADMLVTSIASEAEEEGVMDTLIYYYKKQDLIKLDQLLNSDPTTRQYRSVLLDNRNRNWIPIMQRQMAEKRMFFAVGAGHLSGEFGVIKLLQDQGYKLSPIRVKILWDG